MTFLIAVVCLLAGLGAGIFALRPRVMKSLDVAVDMTASSAKEDFSLSRSLLLIGPGMNDANCKTQRRELKRILGPLLQAEYKIIEIYGDLAPAENGEPYEWLDNQLLRKTLNAEEDFHLIYVNSEGKTSFHSGRPVTAEALLHIFDLWDYITEDAGEDFTNIEDEEEEPAEQILGDFQEQHDWPEEEIVESDQENTAEESFASTAEPDQEDQASPEQIFDPEQEAQTDTDIPVDTPVEYADDDTDDAQTEEEALVASLEAAVEESAALKETPVETESSPSSSYPFEAVEELAAGTTINGQTGTIFPHSDTALEIDQDTIEEQDETPAYVAKRAPHSIAQAIKRRMNADT